MGEAGLGQPGDLGEVVVDVPPDGDLHAEEERQHGQPRPDPDQRRAQGRSQRAAVRAGCRLGRSHGTQGYRVAPPGRPAGA
ncbi:hypothetical protein SDC9_152189 [bioreactor metagenome]|uniref:Uncharacterized protein n=1 Tax=bioreactor metagenome TaxID=1076179 RepID=A0A645EU27_9ZZZZ